MRLTAENIDAVTFTDGLVPVVAQDAATGAVLMLAWADKDALRHSMATGNMTYWSRSRQQPWTKGATSGHTQKVLELHADCDQDAVLAIVDQQGPACHKGTATCWLEDSVATELGRLDALIAARHTAPQGRYTDTLLADSTLAAAKVEEEAAEVLACLRGQQNDDTLAHEAADLLYHLLVALRGQEVSLHDVLAELRSRR